MTVPYGFVSLSVRRFNLTPLNHLRNQQSLSLVPEDYVIDRGHPVTPMLWCHADYAVTVDGTFYTDRASILDINSDCLVRFVPTPETWDDIAFVWSPYVSAIATSYTMNGSLPDVPTLGDIDYQSGRELFRPDTLDFGAGVSLVSDFNDGSDDTFSLTIAMAVNLLDSDQDLIVFDDGAFLRVVPSGFEAFIDGHRFSVKLPKSPMSFEPVYIVLDITPPKATLAVGVSPTWMNQGSSSVSARTTSLAFTLSGVMNLLSLDIWGDDKPSTTEIIARYASVLGVR